MRCLLLFFLITRSSRRHCSPPLIHLFPSWVSHSCPSYLVSATSRTFFHFTLLPIVWHYLLSDTHTHTHTCMYSDCKMTYLHAQATFSLFSHVIFHSWINWLEKEHKSPSTCDSPWKERGRMMKMPFFVSNFNLIPFFLSNFFVLLFFFLLLFSDSFNNWKSLAPIELEKHLSWIPLHRKKCTRTSWREGHEKSTGPHCYWCTESASGVSPAKRRKPHTREEREGERETRA